MKPLDFSLLADENIAPDIVSGLRTRGCDVRTVAEEHLTGQADRQVLDRATAQNRVVLTHDLAFGKADIRAGAPFFGVIYIRPRIGRANVVQELLANQIAKCLLCSPGFTDVARCIALLNPDVREFIHRDGPDNRDAIRDPATVLA